MDRISKALELAREGRSSGTDLPPDEREPKIEYSKTRHLQASREDLRRARVVTALDDSHYADAYKLLRTRLLRRLRQNDWNAIGITSAGAKEGKTLLSINLAISIAKALDSTVLLVDADLRRPSVLRYFGLNSEFGLGHYLEGSKSVEELLIHPGIDRLVLLPGNRIREGASELLASSRMSHLVQELKRRYSNRIVLFDLPPVLVGDDVIGFAPKLDGVLMVVDDNNTRSHELVKAVDLLDGVNLVGTVLNRSTEPVSEYGTYYN